MAHSWLSKVCLTDLGSKESAWPHLCVSWLHMWVENRIKFRNSRPNHLELKDSNLETIAFFFFFF